ncbi:hypothetical protein ABIC90_001436 [Variovorax boronicumulans]
MNHPECLPQYRPCAGTCGCTLALSAENFPTRKGEPNRYPWQPSYYRPRCHRCHREYLAELRVRTKVNRYAKETKRRRDTRAIVKGSLGMTWDAIKAGRAAQKARRDEALARAGRVAETRRTLRAGRPYDPAKDPIKQMIRERQGRYLTRRLWAGPVHAESPETYEPDTVEPDYLRRLEEIRDSHRRQ